MDKLNSLLLGVLNKYKLEETAPAAHLLTCFRQILVIYLGKDVLKKINVVKHVNNSIHVQVENSCLAHELRLHTLNLINDINKRFPNIVIEKIIISQKGNI